MLMVYIKWGLPRIREMQAPHKFFEYSNSKEFLVEPDVFEYDQKMGKPVFDLIIGCNSMEKLGIIMDFKTLVGNSERNSGEFQSISDSGPFFDPIFSDSDSGSDRITCSRQILACQNYVPANCFPNFFIGKRLPPFLLAW